MGKQRVLLVEDEFLIRLTLVDALAEEGFEVIEAESGDEALAMMGGPLGFSLLVTDVQLPGTLNGLALADAARLRDPDLPVLFMTGRPDLVGRPAATMLEAVVSKPYTPSEICATARRLLEAQ